MIEILTVTKPGENHNLDCQGSTNAQLWTKMTPEGYILSNMESSVIVNSPDDQGKFICHNGNKTVIKIAYVYIKGNE